MSTQDLQPGEPVEIHAIWAAGATGPLYSWQGGYVFVAYRDYGQGVLAVVAFADGPLASAECNYDVRSVRRVNTATAAPSK